MVERLLLFLLCCLSLRAQESVFTVPAWNVIGSDYFNCETGSDGAVIDLVSLTNMTYGIDGYWSLTPAIMTSFWFSATSPQALPNPVQIGQSVYFDTPKFVWKKSMTNQGEGIYYNFTNGNIHALSYGHYITFGMDLSTSQQYDLSGTVNFTGGGMGWHCTDTTTNPFVALETAGPQPTVKGRAITGIVTNHWYWATGYYTNNGISALQLWEPTNWTQFGLTSHGDVPYATGTVSQIRFGRLDAHGIFPNVYCYFSAPIVDISSNPRFPLVPVNLVFDRTAPTLTITNPSPNGTTVTGAAQNIQGTASDTGGSGLGVVSVSLNDGAYQDASGTANWQAPVTMNTGASNTIAVKVEDNAGNISSITTNIYQCNSAYTTQDSLGGSAAGVAATGTSSKIALAVDFTAGSTYTLTKVDLYLKKNNSPTQNMNVYIFDDSSNNPNAQVGTGSGTINASTLGASSAAIGFTSMSASLTSGTKYWIVLCVSASDVSNYILADYVGSSDGVHQSGTCNGSGWAAVTQFNRLKFTTYSGG